MEKTVRLEFAQVEAEILEHFLDKKATATGVGAMEVCVSAYWKIRKALDTINRTPPPAAPPPGGEAPSE